MDEQQSAFKGFAVVEIYGHSKAAGYVSTEHFGTACMFRVDTPELPAHEYELLEPEYVDHVWRPKGSKVVRPATPARSELIGPGAIFRLHPCTEEAMKKAVEGMYARPLMLLSLPEGYQVEAPKQMILADPVCGAEIKAEDAEQWTATYENETYSFCGMECRGQFMDRPSDYILGELDV